MFHTEENQSWHPRLVKCLMKRRSFANFVAVLAMESFSLPLCRRSSTLGFYSSSTSELFLSLRFFLFVFRQCSHRFLMNHQFRMLIFRKFRARNKHKYPFSAIKYLRICIDEWDWNVAPLKPCSCKESVSGICSGESKYARNSDLLIFIPASSII